MLGLYKIKLTSVVHSVLYALVLCFAQVSTVEAEDPQQKKLDESEKNLAHSIDSIDDETVTCEEYRLAVFTPEEGWSQHYKNFPAYIKSFDVEYIQKKGLKLAYTLESSSGNRETPVRIRSNKISSKNFTRIDSVTFRLTGNMSVDRLFVTVVDSRGEYFIPKTRIYLSFGQPIEAELSFSSNNVSHRGGNNDGIMDPPLKVYTLNILSNSVAGIGKPIILHDMSILGAISINADDDGNCMKYAAIDPSVVGSVGNERIRDIAPGIFRLPLELNETRYIKYRPEELNKDLKTVKAVVKMCSVLNGDICTRIEKIISKNNADYFQIPVHAGSKGYYALSIEIFDKLKELPVQLESKVLVWDPFRQRNQRNTEHFFGMMSSLDLHPKHIDTDLKLMRDAGVSIVRFPFRWTTVEKERYRFQWKQYDKIFSSLNKYGLLAQPIITQTPEWARKELAASVWSVKPYYKAFTVPKSLQDFSDFVYRSSKRYSSYNPYWEIWNEPFATQYWVGGTKEDYVRMLKAGYHAVKQGSPNSQVLVAGLGVFSPKQKEYVKYILEHGSSDFDIFAYHTHGPSERLDASLVELSGLFAGADRNYEVWINETGIPIDPNRLDGELVRASEFIKKVVLSRASNVQNMTWFIFRQAHKSLVSPNDNYAVIDADGSPRPVLVAYNHIVHLLSGSYAVPLDLKSDANYSYSFRRSNQLIQVFWNNVLLRNKNITVELASPSEEFMITDMFGGKVPYEIIDKTLNVLSNPVYPVFLVRNYQ